MAQAEAALFGDTPEALRLTNPIAADLDQLAPDADRHAGARRAAQRGARLSRCGAVRDRPGVRASTPQENQRWIAAGLRAGATPRNWLAPSRPIDAMDAKADLWAVMAAIGVPLEALMLTQDAPGFYHPGRSATVRQGPKIAAGQLRRTASARAGRARSRRAGRGVPTRPGRRRRAEAPAQGGARPAAVPADPPRLRLPGGQRGDRRCRAACRPRRRPHADHRRVAVRCVSGRAPAGGQEVAGDRGGVPATRAHADRRRDRGCAARRWLQR